MRCCSANELSLFKDNNVAPSSFSQVVSDAGTSDAAAYNDNSGLIVQGKVSLINKIVLTIWFVGVRLCFFAFSSG